MFMCYTYLSLRENVFYHHCVPYNLQNMYWHLFTFVCFIKNAAHFCIIGNVHTLFCNSFLLNVLESFPRIQENKPFSSTTAHSSFLPHFSSHHIHETRLPPPLHFSILKCFIGQMRTRTVVIAMCHYS